MNIGTTVATCGPTTACTDIHIKQTAVIYFIQQFNIFQVNIKPVTLYDFVPQMQIATNKASTEQLHGSKQKLLILNASTLQSRVFIPEWISVLNESFEWTTHWLTHEVSYLLQPIGVTMLWSSV